ncbi:MAG TPA: helix-turn-helix domain-containing protein, partial [Polyangia bacterium]|nr:helix-turn-helix domain-containing protein [Polyangia bacterium]
WQKLAAFTRGNGNRPFVLDGRAAQRVRAIVTSERAHVFTRDALDGLARAIAGELPQVRAQPIDARVAATLERLRCGAPTDERAAISPAHLRALFVRDVGLSMRAYRLWRKLLRATALMASHDVTTAAHAAEFADLAHFSRTCRRLLGHSPTILRRGADCVR